MYTFIVKQRLTQALELHFPDVFSYIYFNVLKFTAAQMLSHVGSFKVKTYSNIIDIKFH